MAESLFATWTHGNSAVAESNATRTLYQGFGVTFTRPDTGSDWIHVPIPTPVFVHGHRARIRKAFCLYNAVGAIIRDFQVFDGASRIHSRTGDIVMTGDHTAIDPSSMNLALRNWADFTGPPDVFWGLSVTLRVDFPTAASRLFIPTAGADLLVTD